MPVVDDPVADAHLCRRNRGAEDSHIRSFPPRLKSSLINTARYRHGTCGNFARVIDVQNLALLISKCVPVILVERAPAIVTGIDAQLKRTVWHFTCVLDSWLHRQNRPRAHVKRHLFESWVQA